VSTLDTLPALLTIREACAFLRVSRRTFYRLVERGELEVVHVSDRSPRVPRSSVAALAEHRDSVAPPDAGVV
jgi:excisionase family DNA binding protein